MPPRSLVTKERVYQAAFDILRNEGIAAITARRVALELGCSTQPVYTVCGGMDEVREEAYRMGVRFIVRAMESHPAVTSHPTLDRVVGYLEVARQERALYQSVYMAAPAELREYRDESIGGWLMSGHLQTNTRLSRGVGDEELSALARHLGVYVTGLGTLFYTGSASFSMEEAVVMITQVYEALFPRGQ